MKYSTPDAREVKRQAAGKWDQIIRSLAPQLSAAIDAGPKKKVSCPFHSGKTNSNFRVLNDFVENGGVACNTCGIKVDGFATLGLAGMSFSDAVKEVSDWMGGSIRTLSQEELAKQEAERQQRLAASAKKQAIRDRWVQKQLNSVWRSSLSLDHPQSEPARRYLASRGLSMGIGGYPSELRFHPALVYMDDDNVKRGEFPALIARLKTEGGKPGSILRIYLTSHGHKLSFKDGKACEVKKLMPHPASVSLTGGAIRLAPASRILGVSEGVETALSAMELYGINCWSCFNTTLLQGFVPPSETEKVIVFADKDVSGAGYRAATTLVERLWGMGIMAGIRLPDDPIPDGSKGIDWNDVLIAEKFPLLRQRTA